MSVYTYFAKLSIFLEEVEFWHKDDEENSEQDDVMAVVVYQIFVQQTQSLRRKETSMFGSNSKQVLQPLLCN